MLMRSDQEVVMVDPGIPTAEQPENLPGSTRSTWHRMAERHRHYGAIIDENRCQPRQKPPGSQPGAGSAGLEEKPAVHPPPPQPRHALRDDRDIAAQGPLPRQSW